MNALGLIPGNYDGGAGVVGTGSAITRISFNSDTGNVFAAFDDLAFRVTGEPAGVIPEPCTLSLLGLGGVLALARRRRR